eukprot:SAG31_NODE_139_length_22847_cov_8.142474_2_plen_148_part_00
MRPCLGLPRTGSNRYVIFVRAMLAHDTPCSTSAHLLRPFSSIAAVDPVAVHDKLLSLPAAIFVHEKNRFEKYGSEIAAALGQPGMTSMGRLSMQQFAELGRERDLRKLKLKGAKMVERKRWSRQILQMIEDYHKAAESRPQASQSEL